MSMFSKIKSRYNSLSVEIRAAFWFTICNFFTKGIKFLTEMIFSRILPTDHYGLLSIYNAWTEILFIFATLRLSAGVYQRGLLQYKNNKYEFTASLLKLSSIVCVGFAIFMFVFSKKIETLIGFSSVLLVITVFHFVFQVAYEFWIAEQRFDFKYNAVVAVTICVCLFGTIASVAGVKFINNTAEVKILCQVITDSLIYFGVFVFIWRKYAEEKKSENYTHIDDSIFWKYALAFNLPLLPHYLSQTVLNQSDRIMIGNLLSPSKAGIYGVAYTIGMVIQILQNSIFLTLQPWRYKNMESEKYRTIDEVSRTILVLFGAIDVLFMAVAPEIITICFKPEFKESMDIIPAISLSSFYMFLYSYFGNIEFYLKKTKFTMISSVICALANVVMNYYGIIIFGYKACAYSTLICYMLYACSHYFAMKAICKKELPGVNIYNMKAIVCICGLVSLASFGTLLIYGYPIIRYIVILIICVITIIYRSKFIELLTLRKK